MPGALLGKVPPKATVESKPIMQMIQSEGGNIVLADEPNHEFVVGAIGKFL